MNDKSLKLELLEENYYSDKIWPRQMVFNSTMSCSILLIIELQSQPIPTETATLKKSVSKTPINLNSVNYLNLNEYFAYYLKASR